jgi:hypothetical protein
MFNFTSLPKTPSMQKLIFGLTILIALTISLSSCKNKKEDPAPIKTPEQLAIEDLAGESSLTWTVANGGTVTRDGRSETNIYQDFEIQFTGNTNSKTYSTSNGNDLFDNSGNWAFVGDNLDKIQLAGTKPASGNEISYTRSGNDLTLTFNIAVPGARTIPNAAVAGSYVFRLKRK